MYSNITKSVLAVVISAWFSTPAWAISDEQLTQLNQAVAKVNQSPEDKKKAFHAYVNHYLDEYEAWRDQYTKTLDQRRADLITKWGEGAVSTATKDVRYSNNDSTRMSIDYEANVATVSVLVDLDASAKTSQELLSVLPEDIVSEGVQIDAGQWQDHAITYSLEKEQAEKQFVIAQTQRQMNELDVQAERLINAKTGAPDAFIYQRAHTKKMALLEQAQARIKAQSELYAKMRAQYGIVVAHAETPELSESEPEFVARDQVVHGEPEKASSKSEASEKELKRPTSPNGRAASAPTAPQKVVSYKVTLPENSLKTRASQYAPLAQNESKNWQVDAALIMAIMHSESAFRPDAKSHIPAYGLMQVVPTSAGHDVNKQVRNIDAPMTPSELYKPTINVETGVAYLDILNRRYLRKIENDESRLYCMIAAYNTGAGNVARAFNADRSTNINKAATVINAMSPDQVYHQLMEELPYDETKGYLKKVTSRIALYQ